MNAVLCAQILSHMDGQRQKDGYKIKGKKENVYFKMVYVKMSLYIYLIIQTAVKIP